MVQGDVPWIIACFALGITGTIFLLITVVKIFNDVASSFPGSNQPASFSLAWIAWVAFAVVDIFQLVNEYHQPRVEGIEGMTRYAIGYVLIFFVMYVVVAAVRAKKIGWVRALSVYSLDKKLDERQRDIQYQATGITFSFLLIAIMSIGILLGVHPPTYQGAYVTLFSTVFFLAIGVRGFITWFLHRR
jgi:ABC-type transport system involved in cytochrome c biogenesis permease subunit